MAKDDLTAARLRELLSYDPDTGEFFRLQRRRGVRVGPVPCTVAGNGYRYITVDLGRYLAHRMVFLYMTGEWPTGEVDHINGIRTDNRFANLRDVSRRVNSENRWKPQGVTRSGARGVSWHDHSRKWRVRINVHGVEHRVGLYDTIEEATAAYVEAKRRLHEGCTI